MNKILISSSLVMGSLLLMGCQTTSAPVVTSNDSNVKGCGFEDMQVSEFALTSLSKKYVTNSISSTPESTDPQFNNKEYFSPVINGTFKFTGERVQKRSYEKYAKPETFQFDKVTYQFKGYDHEKIITNSCQTFWFERGNHVTLIKHSLEKVDGSSFTIDDYKSILNTENVTKYIAPKVKIKHDKFKKTILITGTKEGNSFFRAWGNTDTGKLTKNSVQLYTSVKFRDDWGFIDNAYDEDANMRKVVKIHTNTDCSSRLRKLGLGCSLTEDVGISLPISYLETKPDGFEIKLVGKREAIVRVEAYKVKQILDGVKPYLN